MSNFNSLDPLDQTSIAQATQANNTYIAPDLNLSENILEQAEANANVTSYAASVNTMRHKLNQGYIDRQNLLIENHIHPVVSLDDGVTQDKLDALDAQIQKINSTTRLNNPILTNDQVKQKVKNDFLKASYEQQAGSANENMFERAASGALGWVEGAKYDYKKSLIDAASMVATGMAASATGGGSLLAESAIGGAGMAGQNVVDQARKNQALRLIGLPSKDLFKTAESSFISGTVGTATAIIAGKVVGKVVGGALRKFINKTTVEGYGGSSEALKGSVDPSFKYAGDTYKPESPISEGIDPAKSEMVADNVKELSPQFKAAMTSQDPEVRAAAQDRVMKSNTMVEALDDNEKLCQLKQGG